MKITISNNNNTQLQFDNKKDLIEYLHYDDLKTGKYINYEKYNTKIILLFLEIKQRYKVLTPDISKEYQYYYTSEH